MYILGISAYYHDAAATLLHDGVIVAAAQEERFTRIKHDPRFPVNAIRYCLDSASISIDDLEAVVFYDKPFLKFERLLETYLRFSPKGLRSFLKAMPVWMKEKIFIKKEIRDKLKHLGEYNGKKLKLLFTPHHLSHAASAYYPSSFNESAILTIDGVGEWATSSICKAADNKITIIKEMRFPDSIGLLYSSFTYYLGFKVNSGEYKLMGLAPYGDKKSEQTSRFIDIIKNTLVIIFEDGSVKLNQKYFSYTTGMRMVDDNIWQALFGFPRRLPADPVVQHHSDLALAIQMITEECVTKMAKEAKRLTGSDNLCMAGGVALNCVANGKIKEDRIFSNIYVQPAAGDAGGSTGAALAGYHIFYNNPKIGPGYFDGMSGSYLGPEFTDDEIATACKKLKVVVTRFDDAIEKAATFLADQKVVGWFQGRMEFGPRALGNRSILADPRDPGMQKKLNLKIKFRESFRPFAPAVLSGSVGDYFETNEPNPYMMFVHKAKDNSLPAVTHVDGTARIQTVHEETNPKFHKLISAFKKITGCAVLVNTSFNVRGEPIACTPEDAIRCFMNTEMDVLVMNDYLLLKSEQSEEGFVATKREIKHND